MSIIVPTAGVVIIQDKKVLLIKHGEKAGHITGVYGLPAGRIEENELARQTARRELEEETGLIAAEEDLIEYPNNHYEAIIERKDGEPKIFPYHIFICIKYSGIIRTSAESSPEWIKIDGLKKNKFTT